MPLALALAAAYLVINLAISTWILREETAGRAAPPWVRIVSRGLRYGPPLLGVAYLVTLAGDWPFFLFVIGFFAIAFWLLDGLLNYPERPPPKR